MCVYTIYTFFNENKSYSVVNEAQHPDYLKTLTITLNIFRFTK